MKHSFKTKESFNQEDYEGKKVFFSYNSKRSDKYEIYAYLHSVYYGGGLGGIWELHNPIPKVESELEKKFNEYASKWKDETGLFSTTFQKVANDTYLDIIGMGKEVIPLILKDMQSVNGTAHWHSALKALTKQNPVEEKDLTKNRKIKEAWIAWGKHNNLI
jgi:hypothetical protein